MKKKNFSVSISFPPIFLDNKKAFLSQNRQFQWTNTGNVIYPVVLAYSATLLKKNNYKVYWDDAIAENISYQDWIERLVKRKPDLIAIETKTPVVKKHWQIISDIKKRITKSKIVLLGDHVTALPEESIENSLVDFVLTGGDYDFMLLNLANHLSKKIPLESGFYFKKKNKIINTGKFSFGNHDLNLLPIIDRKLTRWDLYSYKNSNYKYKPGAYIMSGRDCWWGRCTFCSWTTIFPNKCYRFFSVFHTLREIENLVDNFGIKEIFDDSGTLPFGSWLEDFCNKVIEKGLDKKVKFGCNMRFGALNENQYKLMKKAGFRFILYGLESGNQNTLNRINKNLNIGIIEKELSIVKKIGIEAHITAMIGYPWESKSDIKKTIFFVQNLCRKNLIDSLQATIVIPYPGTSLFDQCLQKKLLITDNWDLFDMSQTVIKSKLTDLELKNYIKILYKNLITPKFVFKKMILIRSFDDLKQIVFYGFAFFKKLKDFK